MTKPAKDLLAALQASLDAERARRRSEYRTCKHCGRDIVLEDGRWIDPEATGDDEIWRETCDEHDTFIADHEPEEG